MFGGDQEGVVQCSVSQDGSDQCTGRVFENLEAQVGYKENTIAKVFKH